MQPGRSFITIRSCSCSPRNATVRVRFRDQWFYVDATDTRSKKAFLFLRNLIGVRFVSPEATKAPIVTVPVRGSVSSLRGVHAFESRAPLVEPSTAPHW